MAPCRASGKETINQGGESTVGMPTVAALVPMKAHSERVPNKNVRAFNGRPLFHWILATLRATDRVDEIVVDTDSDRIATGAADRFDATVIDRPEELRGDFVPMNDIILHDISETDADRYLQTHCTNPLLEPETVDDAIETFVDDEEHDSLFSVTPLRTRLWDEDGDPVNHRRDELQRTQDLPPIHEENSNIYLFTASSLQKRDNRIADEPVMYPMEWPEPIDIDEMADFRIAECLHRERHGPDPDIEEVVGG